MRHLFKLLLFSFLLSACKQERPGNDSINSSSKDNQLQKQIQLMPYEDFDSTMLPFLQKEIEKFYGYKTTIIQSKKLPAFAYYKLRNRYKADSLLAYQKALLSDETRLLVGLTKKDISSVKASNPDYGVFGLGFCPGKTCVVSTCRLIWSSKSHDHLNERLLKVVLHEVGHNLGLPHCTKNKSCLMSAAGGTVKQIDRELKWLCSDCRKLLQASAAKQ